MQTSVELLLSAHLSLNAEAQPDDAPSRQMTRQVFVSAIAQGYGADNITGVAQLHI